MTVTLDDAAICLKGACTLEDAETLARLIVEHPSLSVDWSQCDGAHTAVVQALMASGVRPMGAPRSSFLAELVSPALGRVSD